MPIDKPESELSKALASFIENKLSDVLFGCLVLLLFMTFFGWWLGGCYIENVYTLKAKELQVKNVAPIESTTK